MFNLSDVARTVKIVDILDGMLPGTHLPVLLRAIRDSRMLLILLVAWFAVFLGVDTICPMVITGGMHIVLSAVSFES